MAAKRVPLMLVEERKEQSSSADKMVRSIYWHSKGKNMDLRRPTLELRALPALDQIS
jgi:hypothetical protein